jgi:hypothetical protein
MLSNAGVCVSGMTVERLKGSIIRHVDTDGHVAVYAVPFPLLVCVRPSAHSAGVAEWIGVVVVRGRCPHYY